jgi:hypothetical protein
MQLRRGYTKVGNWSLEQICWHLNTVMTFTMRPGPHDAVAVDETAKATLAKILAGQPLPQVTAPERVVPPADAGTDAIDQFLATIERFKTFTGPYAPHRLFGDMPFSDYQRLHLIHSAHHLSHLIPTNS